MNAWRIIIDHARPAQDHMALDECLAGQAIPTVRFFTWDPPAMSLGFKQQLPKWFDGSGWERAGLQLVERPTGGGIALHGSDVSMSVIVPRSPDYSLQALMGAVCDSTLRLCGAYGLLATTMADAPSAERITYCLTQPNPYSVFLNDRKVAGFALRRFPQSWLIQGSLLAGSLPEALMAALPPGVADLVRTRAMALSEAAELPSEQALAQRWAAQWTAWWAPLELVHRYGSAEPNLV